MNLQLGNSFIAYCDNGYKPNSISFSASGPGVFLQQNSNMMLLLVQYMSFSARGTNAQTSILISLFAHATASHPVTSTLEQV